MDYSFKEDLIDDFFNKLGRPDFMSKFLLYIAVCLFIFKIIVICSFVNFPPNIFFADITKIALTNLVNQSRQEAGIQMLVENKKLDLAAKLKAKDMVQKGYFSHQSPEGMTPWYWFKVIGYNYKYAGENLAIGFFDSQALYSAWLNSPSHKDNLLNPKYKEIGTAVLSGFGPNNAIVVVQLFGNPSAPLSQNQTDKETIDTKESEGNIKKTEIEQLEKNEAAENIPEKSISKEVLSQYTERTPLLEKSVGNDENRLYLRILNFLSYDYDRFLQYIIYGFLTLMLVVLFFYFFVKHGNYHNDLLFRLLVIVVILSAAALLNKEAIYLISPRQIII